MNWLKSTLKAWIGAIVAALAIAAQSSADGRISLQEGIYIAAAFFSTLAVVYGVGNAPATGPAVLEAIQTLIAQLTARLNSSAPVLNSPGQSANSGAASTSAIPPPEVSAPSA